MKLQTKLELAVAYLWMGGGLFLGDSTMVGIGWLASLIILKGRS